MRFVDIQQLTFPEGWHPRATEALDQLRQEIVAAEAKAFEEGRDPILGRKEAIKAGLKIPARQQVWRDLNPRLARLTNGKCWYSESRNPTADKNVDHFRPKNRVEGVPNHEGYWWLAFAWRNYRYASQWCNQRRVDETNGTSGGKWDQFPLCPGSFRATTEFDDIDLEEPELLDPIDPEDWKLLTFRTDGYPTPARGAGTIEHLRAETSIRVYHLHCRELVRDRVTTAGIIQRIVQDLETLQPKIGDPRMRALYKRREIELIRAIRSDSEYSAAALAFARAEVYTRRAGVDVKRQWLEDILNASP